MRRSSGDKLAIQRAHRDETAYISSLHLADISFSPYEDEYVQSFEVVYTIDRVAAAGRWQRRIFVAIIIYWHVLKARRGAQDRGACVGQLYFLKRRLGVVRGWKCQVARAD